MNDATTRTIAAILEELTPTTLAAIAADIDDNDMPSELARDFRLMVQAMGEALIGENDFNLMISTATESDNERPRLS